MTPLNEPTTYPVYVTDILLLDIVGFSKLTGEQQYATVQILTKTAKQNIRLSATLSFRALNEVVRGFIPTGDGFYVILQPELAGYGVLLAASLRSGLLLAARRAQNLFQGVRIAVHLGAAVPFQDLTDRENFVGPGLNDCARLFGAQLSMSPTESIPEDENFIVISEEAYDYFRRTLGADRAMKQFLNTIKFRVSDGFEITDKHGKVHRARFAEASRVVAINPPRPADFEERRRRWILEQLASRERNDKNP